jgi:4-hydroxy-4-methyl-2-oxoglutarate aldolase
MAFMTTMAPEAIANDLNQLPSSLVADVRAGKGVVAPGLIRFGGKGIVAGKAITAACAEGSLQAVYAALEHARAGDFLVVSAPGNSAYLGEVLATHLVNLKLAGVIIDGFVRDREALAAMDLSVFARGLFPHNQRRREVGTPMVELVVGEVAICPGDWVVADDDGIVIVPASDVERDIEACRSNRLLEERVLELVQQRLSPPEAVRQAMVELTK